MNNNDQIKTFLLFEATLKSIDVIRDEKRKMATKHFFKRWSDLGIRYFKELEKEIPLYSDTREAYDELSGITYDVIDKLIETEHTSELLSEIQTILKKY